MNKKPARFNEFERRAADLVHSKTRLQRIVGQAVDKIGRSGGDRFAQVKEQLVLLVALLRAWLRGDYREVSNNTLVVVAAAVLYFVVPFDVIPDFLFGWGLLDDAAVVAYVFGRIRSEMDAFAQWQKDQDGPHGADRVDA